MKIAFTQSRRPNFFSHAIEQVDGSPYTHVVVYSGHKLPTGDELVLHSQWNAGLLLSPASSVIGSKIVKEFEDGCAFDWDLVIRLINKFGGVENYGWAQATSHLLKYLNLGVPQFITKRFPSELYCSEVIVRINQKQGKMLELNPDQTGPGELYRYCVKHLEGNV